MEPNSPEDIFSEYQDRINHALGGEEGKAQQLAEMARIGEAQRAAILAHLGLPSDFGLSLEMASRKAEITTTDQWISAMSAKAAELIANPPATREEVALAWPAFPE